MKRTSALLALSLASCELVGGITASEASCNTAASKHCAEYVGLQPATAAIAKASCDEEKGTFKENAKCDLGGSVGGCRRKTMTDYFFPGGTLDNQTIQTAEDLVAACYDGAYVDSTRKEWSSDAGLPRGCTAASGLMTSVTLRNLAPVRLNIHQCIGMSFELVGEVDAGTTAAVSPVIAGETLHVSLGSYTLKTFTIPGSGATVDVP